MRRWFGLGLAVALTAMLGCGRSIEPLPNSEGGVGTVTPPTPTDARLELASGQITVHWNVADATSVTGYRIYRGVVDQSGLGLYATVDGAGTREFVDIQVANDVIYQYEVAALIGEIEGDRSVALFGSPGVFGVSLELGVDKTSGSNIFPGSRVINVQVIAPAGALAVQLSENEDPSTAPVRPFAGGAARFTLSEGDGEKTVYGLVLGPAGVTSEILSDSIILDSRAVISSVTENSGGVTLGANDIVHFRVDCEETGGTARVDLLSTSDMNPVVVGIPMFDDGTLGDAVPNDGIYERDWVVPAGLDLDSGLAEANFTDDVGNPAVPVTATTVITISSAANPARAEEALR